MKRATKTDKNRVVDILTESFDKNQSVNYIIKSSGNRIKHIRALMEYSFDLCNLFGDVFLSEDNKACALIIYPDKKKTTVRSILLDIVLVLRSTGISNIRKALAREALLSNTRGKELMTCLWFIGVDPKIQHMGIGSNLLQSVIEYSKDNSRPIYLETSNSDNLPWYQNFGFKIYATEDLGHTLYFLKRKAEK